MKILLIYFSYTSNVRTVAQSLLAALEQSHEVTCAEIEPQRARGYWGWLARSFIPGWTVAIRPTVTDLGPFDLVVLGFPKWTLSCPPVNRYVKSIKNAAGKPVALLMSYGGFDEERYLAGMVRRLGRRGTRVVATCSVRRRMVRQGQYDTLLQTFCGEMLQRRG